MYLLISADSTLSLEDTDNMNGFSIVENSDLTRSSAFSAMSIEVGEGHYWINVDSVIQLSSRRDDQQWVDDFWDMLKKAEPYGYADLVNKRVKAHVETS